MPNNLIKVKLINLIEWTFKRKGSPYIACNERQAFFTSEDTKRYKLWSCQNVCEVLIYILNTEQELDSIYEYRAKGAQIRARAEWIEQGEKSSKFFLGLEKRRQIKKNIKTLATTDGRTITDQTDILNEQVNYYKDLYTSQANDTAKMANYLNSTRLENKLSQADMHVCEQNITTEECKQSLF